MVHLVALVLVAAFGVVETGDGVADAVAEVDSSNAGERERSAARGRGGEGKESYPALPNPGENDEGH